MTCVRFDRVGSNGSKFSQTIAPLRWMDAKIMNSSTDDVKWFAIQ